MGAQEDAGANLQELPKAKVETVSATKQFWITT